MFLNWLPGALVGVGGSDFIGNDNNNDNDGDNDSDGYADKDF